MDQNMNMDQNTNISIEEALEQWEAEAGSFPFLDPAFLDGDFDVLNSDWSTFTPFFGAQANAATNNGAGNIEVPDENAIPSLISPLSGISQSVQSLESTVEDLVGRLNTLEEEYAITPASLNKEKH